MASKKRPTDPEVAKDFLLRNKHYMEIVRKLRLIDDDLMSKVFEKAECTQLLLDIILERKDLVVKHVRSQYDILNLHGRSARLDIFATDEEGRTYNVEVQRSDKGADVKRARYNSSLLDANLTNPGDEYDELSETYVIFITENDVIGAGLPIYHIDRFVRETGKMFDDGAHIIYVNAQHISDTPLGKLMHDFNCLNAEDMHYTELATQVHYFKETEEGIANMCKEVEKLVNEKSEIRYVEGKAEVLIQMMKITGKSYNEVVASLGYSDDEIAALKPIVEALLEAENAGK